MAQSGAANARAPESAQFNSSFLSGQAKQVDLAAFSNGNPMVAGNYRVDVYVNGAWQGRRDLQFKADAQGRVDACLPLPMLEEMGVDSEAVLLQQDPSVPTDKTSCVPVQQRMANAYGVYDSGNLPLNLLYNLMLESTGRLQKCRLYEMTANRTARSTIAYLIVRDQAHENAYAKALEALGVNWNTLLPIPKTNAEKFPEVATLLEQGLQSKQYTFSLDQLSEAGKLYRGPSPSNDGTTLSTAQAPDGVPMDIAVERPEEFGPGLDPELLAMVQAVAEMEGDEPAGQWGRVG